MRRRLDFHLLDDRGKRLAAMALCLIALGSNQGDRAIHLSAALNALASHSAVRVVARSRWHATCPVGGPERQDEFLNGAAVLETSLGPWELWQVLRTIEEQLGRVRTVRWGPRVIDLDLLLYDDLVVAGPELEIPHPRMAMRRFVLVPAAEIAPEWRHPRVGWTLARLRDHLDQRPNYVALTGTPHALIRAAARAAATAVSGQLLSDETDPMAADVELETLAEHRRRLLSSLVDRESTVDVISDFWMGELNVAWQVRSVETRRRSPPCGESPEINPKLLVLVRAAPPLSTYGQALEDAACRPHRGPWLTVDEGAVESIVAEVTAALAAMR